MLPARGFSPNAASIFMLRGAALKRTRSLGRVTRVTRVTHFYVKPFHPRTGHIPCISYWDGRGILREVLATCTQQDFAISRLQIDGERKDRNQSGFQSNKGLRWQASQPRPVKPMSVIAHVVGSGTAPAV